MAGFLVVLEMGVVVVVVDVVVISSDASSFAIEYLGIEGVSCVSLKRSVDSLRSVVVVVVVVVSL